MARIAPNRGRSTFFVHVLVHVLALYMGVGVPKPYVVGGFWASTNSGHVYDTQAKAPKYEMGGRFRAPPVPQQEKPPPILFCQFADSRLKGSQNLFKLNSVLALFAIGPVQFS